jgi:hypothetical protein
MRDAGSRLALLHDSPRRRNAREGAPQGGGGDGRHDILWQKRSFLLNGKAIQPFLNVQRSLKPALLLRRVMGERTNGLSGALRSGAWVTRERVRLVAAAVLAASAVGVLYLVLTANGRIDASGQPLGTDFSNVYAAGTAVLEGRPELPFDPPQQYAREQAIFGPATPFYGWHYPPFFLFVAAALALLPYLPALAFWQLTTFALYLIGIRAILQTTAVPATPKSEAAAPILPPAMAPARQRVPGRLHQCHPRP